MIDDPFELEGDLINGLIPWDPLEAVADPFQWIFEAIGIMLVVRNIHPFAACVSFAFHIGLVGFHFDDPVVFDFQLQTTVLGA
jgi:hypothetical protein